MIGIDLGTTNCTMACIAPDQQNIEQISIPQIVQPGNQGQVFSLPSNIYFPLPEEVQSQNCTVDWAPERNHTIGLYARERGGEVPGRLITSSKSWLCHTGVDRRCKLLPVEGDDNIVKMSPLEATSEILRHLKEAWDNTHAAAPLDQQQVLITVPASFDPSARQLVQEAAESVGYPAPILLEEPQAAFYAWLEKHQKDWRKQLRVGDIILVIDIGGGTTDFTLIEVTEDHGDLILNRMAVGSHLLLGGDNIDLALAYFVRSKLEAGGHIIDDWQFQGLIYACRRAKEGLLSENPPETFPITVLGRGRKLIGGTITTDLTLKEIQELLIDGFTPLVGPEERSSLERRSGIQQVGLPYAQDARISCQLARFLAMTEEDVGSGMDKFVVPTAVLFNGGTLKSHAFRERLLELLNSWAKRLGKPTVKELPGSDYDFAVSRGAAYYGLARAGEALRIRGGISRSYFIGVEEAIPAVPGFALPLSAVCIAPFGMEEGTEQTLQRKEFALLLGEHATFRFFSRSTPNLPNGEQPVIGTVVKDWKQQLTELHPIETILTKNPQDGKTVRVKLHSKVTELGVLELWFESEDGRKWKLEFDLREQLEPEFATQEVR